MRKITYEQILKINKAIFWRAGGTTRQHIITGQIKWFDSEENIESGWGDITGISCICNNEEVVQLPEDVTNIPNYWHSFPLIMKAKEWLFKNGRYVDGYWDTNFLAIEILWKENEKIIFGNENYYHSATKLPPSSLMCLIFLLTTRYHIDGFLKNFGTI